MCLSQVLPARDQKWPMPHPVIWQRYSTGEGMECGLTERIKCRILRTSSAPLGEESQLWDRRIG